MYTPHALFSQDLPIHSFSLYRRSASDPSIWDKFRISVIIDRLESEGKVWWRSVYIHTVNRIMCCWDMAIWSFSRWPRPPSWIWSKRKWRRSICRPWKPHPRTKHHGDRMMRCRVMAIWNCCKMCEWALRSVGRSLVGNQYSYFLHWSHILLFCYVRNVAGEE